MNHYDRDNILDLCSKSHRLTTALARKVGMDQQDISAAEQGLRLMADKMTRALSNRSLYTVSIARLSKGDELEHETLLTTPLLEEARQLRDDINNDLPLFGAKRIAQIVSREVRPRKWELWTQVSEDEIHLRCQITQARALLRSPEPDVLVRLYSGKTLVQDRSIYLQSERVEVTINFTSTQRVKFTTGGGHIVIHDVKVCTPSLAYLDVNQSSQLMVDARQGVVAKFPIEDGLVTLPGDLAKALRLDGTALLVRDLGNGRIRARLTHQELLKRLEISRPRQPKRTIVPFIRPISYQPALMAA